MGKYELEFRRIEEQLRARRTKIKHQDAVDALALVCSMADSEIKKRRILHGIVVLLAVLAGFGLGGV